MLSTVRALAASGGGGILIATALALILLTGCEQDRVTGEPVLTVNVYEIGPPVVNSEETFHGRVVPADLTRVAFRVAGKITRLEVQPGEEVVKGQVIAQIEDRIPRQVLADAQAQYDLSRKQLDRAQNLLDIGALTRAQRDELQAVFRLARANLELAKRALSYTVIEAPFDGQVIDVEKEVFESVAPGETVAMVYRTERIDVLVNIPDGLPGRIHQPADSRAYRPMVTFPGAEKVYAMKHLKNSGARNPETQTFQIWLTMPAGDAAFVPGLPVTITVDLEEAGFTMDPGLVVPLSALEPAGESGAFQVWRYEEGVVNPVEVTIGRISQAGALLSSGLQVGDLIVISRLSLLVPGLAVDIKRVNQDS